MCSARGKADRIRVKGYERERLLAEVHSLCPLCGDKLLHDKAGKQVRRYELAHIYPHSPTKEQTIVLEGVSKPDDVESLSNLIPLCKKCHGDYDAFTTKDEYIKLYGIKQRAKGEYEAKVELAEVYIEPNILKVLQELEKIDHTEFHDLSMDPVPVKKKIPSGALQTKVLGLATQYYNYMRTQFQSFDRDRASRFDIIASEVSIAWKKARAHSMLQEDVFESIVEWMRSKTRGTRSACEAVVSFFVQNCEVFSASSK